MLNKVDVKTTLIYSKVIKNGVILLKSQYFFDLFNECHLQINNIKERLWNEMSDIYISNSEWFIMRIIYKNTSRMSYVSKQINISRQATHKFIKNLESKGLLKISNLQNNKKDKCVQLTKLGEQCVDQYDVLMSKLDNEIVKKYGHNQFELLNKFLKSHSEF